MCAYIYTHRVHIYLFIYISNKIGSILLSASTETASHTNWIKFVFQVLSWISVLIIVLSFHNINSDSRCSFRLEGFFMYSSGFWRHGVQSPVSPIKLFTELVLVFFKVPGALISFKKTICYTPGTKFKPCFLHNLCSRTLPVILKLRCMQRTGP